MTATDWNEQIPDWPQPNLFKRSIRMEIALIVGIVILCLMAVTGFVFTKQYVETITANAIETLLVQARSYSGPAGKHILSSAQPDALLLGNICRKLSADNSDIFWVGIAGTDNQFLAHSDIKKVVTAASLTPLNNAQIHSALRTGEAFAISDDTIQIQVTIVEQEVEVGTLGIASSAKQISRARTTSIVGIASTTLLMILIGLPLTMLLLDRKLRPISLITAHLRQVTVDDMNLAIPVDQKNEFGYLAETLGVMGHRLNLAQKSMLERERRLRELEIAREIQANILPHRFPGDAAFEFAGAYRSAKEVGGDYYDFIEIDEDHIAFLVADVSGKSLPGMLVMLLTRDIIQRLVRFVMQPAQLLSEVNRELLLSIRKGMFVTMFFAVLNKKSGELVFASAGHNPLIHFHGVDHKAELIKTKGYPLGMMSPTQFAKRIETGTVTLAPGDCLVQYTDGINEAQNSDQEEYGMDRFVTSLEECAAQSPSEITREILRSHEAFVDTADQYDDITLVVLKWLAKAVDVVVDTGKENYAHAE